MSISRVLFLWDWQISLPPELAMRFEHASIAIRNDWIAESRHINPIPSSTEDDITHEDFIFEGCSEGASPRWVLHNSFDASANAWHCFQLSSSELRNFEVTCEHAFDKGSVFHNFIGLTDKFEFLHDLELGIHLKNYACSADSEMRNISIIQVLNTKEGRSDSKGRCIQNCVAEAEFRCVLYHSHALLSLQSIIFHRVNRYWLEFTPAYWESYWVTRFHNMRIPSVFLDFHS